MNKDKILQVAREVIDTEAQAILALNERIDDRFVQACQYLHDCKGRIIVMGMGKSGHIAKKLAATFASTGSPAFFIHPSEAKHGDIGMITQQDAVLALSNSGESEEITAILPALHRIGVPLISLTGKPQSTLAKAATINIDVSVSKEACPLGLAPTSSTTATLVMGDAIAMALLDMRGFTKHDFALSHPGGTLGKRLLLKVNQLMHKETAMPIIHHEASLKEALIEMTHKKLGITTVVNQQGELLGIFTDGDVRRALDKNAAVETQIQELMSANPKTIHAEMLAAEALTLMQNHKITALIVADQQRRPIGIVHIHDILRAGVM